MRPLYIFDLDGTLADASHRQPILDGPGGDEKWRAFFAACPADKPIHAVLRTMEALRQHADVWIFSGRSDEVFHQTAAWLCVHTTFRWIELETALVMRRAGDCRADDVVKREFVERMLEEDLGRLVAVFDDRDRVVAMWRSLGIPCFQVAPGNF